MAIYDVYVVGMRRELFVDYLPGEEAYEEDPGENTKDILFCVTYNGSKKFTITLITRYGWCGSGYTTATWGDMFFDEVQDFGPASHLPKEHKLKIEGLQYDASQSDINKALVWNNYDDGDDNYYPADYKTNVFSVSFDGDDKYYPGGYAEVNDELFTELPRAMKQRPVWILNGTSGTGKSTIGHMIKEFANLIIYETDSVNNGNLPKEIWADIIVVGNKWNNINIDTVKAHLPKNVMAIDVRFSI